MRHTRRSPRTHGATKAAAALAAVALVATACGGGDSDASAGGDDGGSSGSEGGGEGGDEGGPEGEPVLIGGIFDLSGATGDVGTPYSEGARDYIDWRNTTQDGVGGRPLELDWQDYAYDVATAEQLYTQYVSSGAVAIQGWGTGDTEALRTLVAADELPFMSASWAETLIDPEETPYNFVVGSTYSDQMRVALQWIDEDAGGATEVAVFHNDSPFGTSPVADGQAYIEDQGYEMGYEAYPMPGGATDYVGEISRAEGQGAEYIVIQNVSSPAAQLVQNLANQGSDIQVVCLNWCAGEILIELAGDAAEGVIGVHPFLPPNADAEGLQPIAEYLEGEGDSIDDKDIFYVQGWYTMHVMAEAIADLVESGEEVTGPAIREALESGEAVDTGVSEPIDFSDESHRGMSGSNLFRVEDGVYVPFEQGVTP
jgi:branched-chain amino acid transport system substrate-binding protein